MTEKDFQRKIQLWTLGATLIVAVMGSLTAIGLAYLNKPKTEYIMSPDDQLEVNKLSAQINRLSKQFLAAQDQTEREKLDAELRVLAETEATIMRKYNPNYRPRWPLGHKSESPIIVALILITLMVGIYAYYAFRSILNKRYRKQLLYAYIIEELRRHNSGGATTSEIKDYIRKEHPHYKPEEIDNALWELQAEHEIQISGSQCSLIPG